jgi:hypothetical protein
MHNNDNPPTNISSSQDDSEIVDNQNLFNEKQHVKIY